MSFFNVSCSAAASPFINSALICSNPSSNSVVISNIFAQDVVQRQVTVAVSGVINAPSTQPTGFVLVSTLYDSSDKLSIIDSCSNVTYQFSVGSLNGVSVVCVTPTVNTLSYYYVLYQNTFDLDPNSMVVITVPDNATINQSTVVVSINGNLIFSTRSISGQNISVTMSSSVGRHSQVNITIQLYNPTITGLTSSFRLYEYNSNSYAIDKAETGLSVNITTPQDMYLLIAPVSTVTGVPTDYRFVFTPTVTHPSNASFVLNLPPCVTFSTVSCTYPSNCSASIINTSAIRVILNQVLNGMTTTYFVLTTLVNPRSTRTSSNFTITSSFNDSLLNSASGTVQMTIPNILTVSDPMSSMKYYSSTLPINLTLSGTNPLHQTDYMMVTLSSFYQQSDNIKCLDADDICTLDAPNKIKVVTSLFSPIQFSISGFTTGAWT